MNEHSPEVKSEGPRGNTGSKVFLGLLLGCGCLTLGVFLLGIVLAIALPSFLNQATRARQSEAENYLGAALRSQQVYLLQHGMFAKSAKQLEVAIPNQTQNYRYEMRSPQGNKVSSVITAKALQPELVSYTGVIVAAQDGNTETQICRTREPSQEPPVPPKPPTRSGAPLQCPPGSAPLEE